jgi:hypothetical protein
MPMVIEFGIFIILYPSIETTSPSVSLSINGEGGDIFEGLRPSNSIPA